MFYYNDKHLKSGQIEQLDREFPPQRVPDSHSDIEVRFYGTAREYLISEIIDGFKELSEEQKFLSIAEYLSKILYKDCKITTSLKDEYLTETSNWSLLVQCITEDLYQIDADVQVAFVDENNYRCLLASPLFNKMIIRVCENFEDRGFGVHAHYLGLEGGQRVKEIINSESDSNFDP